MYEKLDMLFSAATHEIYKTRSLKASRIYGLIWRQVRYNVAIKVHGSISDIEHFFIEYLED